MQKETFKEIAIYSIVAISSLIVLAYTVHMFVGGLVSEETQYIITAAVLCTAVAVMVFMVMDVVKRRRSSHHDR